MKKLGTADFWKQFGVLYYGESVTCKGSLQSLERTLQLTQPKDKCSETVGREKLSFPLSMRHPQRGGLAWTPHVRLPRFLPEPCLLLRLTPQKLGAWKEGKASSKVAFFFFFNLEF